MGDAYEGGPVRLGVLLASIAILVVVAVKTVHGTDGASASRADGHGVPGRVVAIAVRRQIPRPVRRQVAFPHVRGSAAVHVAGATYLLGGIHRDAHGRRRPVASVLRSVGGSAPTRVAKLPMPVSGAAAAVVGDRLYAIGGRLSSGKLSREVQEYDVATERSVIAARLPKALWHTSALTLDGYVYVLGGETRSGPTAAILRFDPWRDAVSWAGHLPVRATGGAAAASSAPQGLSGGGEGAGGGKPELRDHPARAALGPQPIETRSITNTSVAFGGIVGGWP